MEQKDLERNRITIRKATLDDADILVNYRIRMFEDMRAEYAAAGERQETPVAPRVFDQEQASVMYWEYLQKHLGNSMTVWIAERDGVSVASAAVSLMEWPPSPGNLSHQVALLHSVYTEPGNRRKGFARLLVETALDYCQQIGVKRVNLTASLSGERLYESLGFRWSSREMRLRMDGYTQG